MTDPDPLAVLAAQLEELREELRQERGQLARIQGELGAARTQLETGLDACNSQIMLARVDIKQAREELAEAVEKNRLKPPPAPWWGVDREQAAAMLAELRRWVETFLRPNYPDYLVRLPDCWASHGAAIWELSTLRAEWIRVYGDEENRDLAGALNWLNRYFPDTLDRLAAAIRCPPGSCQMARRAS